jgi:hypothetical protein
MPPPERARPVTCDPVLSLPYLILDKVAALFDDVAFDLAYLLEQLRLVFGVSA